MVKQKMAKNDSDRLTRLEKKVDWIIRLVAIQFGLTCLIVVSYGFSSVLRLLGTVCLLLVVAIPLLYVFRGSLPPAARSAAKRIGNFVGASFRRLRALSQR